MQFYQKRRENCVKTHVILKKASFYACLTLFAGMAFPMPLWASQSTAIVQQHVKQITGIVNDTSGAPVIGANVVEVGSTNGTITDVDGKFTLNVSVGAKLKVSYIGYNDQQITVGNSNSYTIILKEDTESLDEVVVVGYGTQKKVNLTGSVATISSDKLVNRTSANVTNMLAGQMPGVTIIQNTGQPGADAGVLRVRGLGTMGDASAMVVVDGVESTMSSVDPNDIENISILKRCSRLSHLWCTCCQWRYPYHNQKGNQRTYHCIIRWICRLAKCLTYAQIFGFLQLCSADE